MKELNKDIKEAIEKSIPKQLSGELIKRFTELEKKEVENTRLIEDLAREKKETMDLYAEVKALEALKLKDKELTNRENKLYLEESKFEIRKEINELKISEANKRADTVNNLVGILVKHPNAMTTLNTSYSNMPHYNSDGSITHERTGAFTTIDKTEE